MGNRSGTPVSMARTLIANFRGYFCSDGKLRGNGVTRIVSNCVQRYPRLTTLPSDMTRELLRETKRRCESQCLN